MRNVEREITAKAMTGGETGSAGHYPAERTPEVILTIQRQTEQEPLSGPSVISSLPYQHLSPCIRDASPSSSLDGTQSIHDLCPAAAERNADHAELPFNAERNEKTTKALCGPRIDGIDKEEMQCTANTELRERLKAAEETIASLRNSNRRIKEGKLEIEQECDALKRKVRGMLGVVAECEMTGLDVEGIATSMESTGPIAAASKPVLSPAAKAMPPKEIDLVRLASERIEKLEIEVRECRSRLKQQEMLAAAAKDAVAAKDEELARARHMILEARNSQGSDDKENSIQGLSANVKKLKEELENLRKLEPVLEAAEKAKVAAERRATKAISDRNKTLGENQTLKSDLEKLQNQVKAENISKRNVSKLQKQLEKVSEANKDAQKQILSLEEQLEEKQKALTTSDQRFRTAEAEANRLRNLYSLKSPRQQEEAKYVEQIKSYEAEIICLRSQCSQMALYLQEAIKLQRDSLEAAEAATKERNLLSPHDDGINAFKTGADDHQATGEAPHQHEHLDDLVGDDEKIQNLPSGCKRARLTSSEAKDENKCKLVKNSRILLDSTFTPQNRCSMAASSSQIVDNDGKKEKHTNAEGCGGPLYATSDNETKHMEKKMDTKQNVLQIKPEIMRSFPINLHQKPRHDGKQWCDAAVETLLPFDTFYGHREAENSFRMNRKERESLMAQLQEKTVQCHALIATGAAADNALHQCLERLKEGTKQLNAMQQEYQKSYYHSENLKKQLQEAQNRINVLERQLLDIQQRQAVAYDEQQVVAALTAQREAAAHDFYALKTQMDAINVRYQQSLQEIYSLRKERDELVVKLKEAQSEAKHHQNLLKEVKSQIEVEKSKHEKLVKEKTDMMSAMTKMQQYMVSREQSRKMAIEQEKAANERHIALVKGEKAVLESQIKEKDMELRALRETLFEERSKIDHLEVLLSEERAMQFDRALETQPAMNGNEITPRVVAMAGKNGVDLGALRPEDVIQFLHQELDRARKDSQSESEILLGKIATLQTMLSTQTANQGGATGPSK